MTVELVGLALLGLWVVIMVVVLMHPSRHLWVERFRQAVRNARLGNCVDPEVTRAVDQAFNHQRPPF
jgi:hypothetical protein